MSWSRVGLYPFCVVNEHRPVSATNEQFHRIPSLSSTYAGVLNKETKGSQQCTRFSASLPTPHLPIGRRFPRKSRPGTLISYFHLNYFHFQLPPFLSSPTFPDSHKLILPPVLSTHTHTTPHSNPQLLDTTPRHHFLVQVRPKLSVRLSTITV